MTVSSVTQRMGVHYGGSVENLEAVLTHLSPDVVVTGGDKKIFRLFSAVDVIVDNTIVTLEVNFDIISVASIYSLVHTMNSVASLAS